MDVRRKAISVVLNMTSSRNVEEVVLFLKKQLQRTQEADFDGVSYDVSAFLITYRRAPRHLSTGNS